MNFLDSSMRRTEMVRNWRVWIEKIARIVKELLPDAEIYVVGSVARGDYVASSDVDVLVVAPSVPSDLRKRAEIKVLIEDKLQLPYYHPFEIHLLRPEEAEPYLRRARGSIIKML